MMILRIFILLLLPLFFFSCSNLDVANPSENLALAPDYSDPMLPSSTYKKSPNNPSSIMNTATNFDSAIIIFGIYNRVDLINYEDILIKKLLNNSKFRIIDETKIEKNNIYYNILDVEFDNQTNKIFFDVSEFENSLY